MRIQQLLEENEIHYIQEYKFKDCVSPKGNLLKFDFYLPEYNIVIEYDGEQHFYLTAFGENKSGEERLKENQEYDNIKNEYCKENGIQLIRIPYTKYSTLCLNDLIEGGLNDK